MKLNNINNERELIDHIQSQKVEHLAETDWNFIKKKINDIQELNLTNKQSLHDRLKNIISHFSAEDFMDLKIDSIKVFKESIQLKSKYSYNL